jgi:protein gp37
MPEAWVEQIRLQCEQEEVAFFFKQWGGVRKKSFGRTLNGQTFDQMPTPIRSTVESLVQIAS